MVELNKWYNDLIGCLSQCYYYFKENNKLKCIYLRWRWSDPWTAYLLTFKDNAIPKYYGGSKFDDANWELLNIGYFLEDEVYKLQKIAVKKLVKRSIFSKIFKRNG